MASSADEQRIRKRDKYRPIALLKVPGSLFSRVRSRSPSLPNSSAQHLTSPASATSPSSPRFNPFYTLHQQAFEKYKQLEPEKAATFEKLCPKFDDSNLSKTGWQQQLSSFIKDKQSEDKEQRPKIQLGGKERLILGDYLGKAAGWINSMIAVGDSAVQFDPVHAALPWAGFRFVLKSAINYHETQKTVWNGTEIICKDLAWISLQERLFYDGNSTAEKQLQDACLDFYIEIFGTLGKYISYYHERKLAKVLKSPFASETEFAECFNRLEGLKTRVRDCSALVARDSQIGAREDIKNLLSYLARFDEPFQHVQEVRDEMFEFMAADEERRTLDWISQIPHADHLESAYAKAMDGTGEWLWTEQEFVTWQESSVSQVLRVHGGPGSGKSTLLSMLVKKLQSASERSSSLSPVWFFCLRSSDQKERSDPISIIRSLVRQLAISPTDKKMNSRLVKIYQERDQKGLPQKFIEILDMCKELVQDRGPTFILIDALDECNPHTRGDLLRFLTGLLESCSQLVKIFVTSRDDRQQSTILDYPEIRITADINRSDIDRYIDTEVKERIKRKEILDGLVSDELRAEIIETLRSKADGMFRWVALQLQLLSRRENEDDIRTDLSRLPADLQRSYMGLFEYEMQGLPKEHKQYNIAIRSFKWLLVAKSELSEKDFCILTGHFHRETGQPAERQTLLRYCFSLVEFDETRRVFKLCHLSVREFFESQEFLSKNEEFREERLHAEAASICLDLVFHGIKSKIELPGYPLTTWPYHASKAAECRLPTSPLQLSKKLEKLLLEQECFDSWVELVSPRKCEWLWDYDDTRTSNQLPAPHRLMVACQWGLHEYVKEIGKHMPKETLEDIVMSRVYRQYDLVCAAAQFGHEQVLKTLFELGMSARMRPGRKYNPIFCAIRHGHCFLVPFLLDNEGEVDGIDIVYGSPLMAAAEHNQCDTIRLLINRGAKVDLNGIPEGTALVSAASHGNVEAFTLLIQNGADVNLVGGKYGTALGAAAWGGKIEIIQLLFERGADVNLVGEDFGTALGVAAARGEIEIIQLLLERGADVNLVGGDYGTALGAAAWGGEIEIIQLLLERGADVNLVGGAFGTALGAAAAGGEIEIIQLLLERGADVNLVEGVYGTALGAAAAGGKIEIIQLLLERGADVNLVGGHFGTALGVAIWRGKIEIIQLLLERGADVNLVGGYFGTALGVAIWRGKIEIIRLLLERGADVNLVGGEYGTALGAAAYRGKIEIIQLLLERGADVNLVGGRFRTALGAAAARGEIEIIQLLLERGAEVNLRFWGRTPLDIYTTDYQQKSPWSRNRREVTDLLVKHGAEHSADFQRGEARRQQRALVAQDEIFDTDILFAMKASEELGTVLR